MIQQNKHKMDNTKGWNGFTQKLSRFQPGFSPDFDQQLMRKLAAVELDPIPEIIPVFRVFALSGIAAIGLLMIGLYFSNGSLNLDSLLGISGYTPDMGLLSFL
jgi:hypothetical protein